MDYAGRILITDTMLKHGFKFPATWRASEIKRVGDLFELTIFGEGFPGIDPTNGIIQDCIITPHLHKDDFITYLIEVAHG